MNKKSSNNISKSRINLFARKYSIRFSSSFIPQKNHQRFFWGIKRTSEKKLFLGFFCLFFKKLILNYFFKKRFFFNELFQKKKNE